MGATHARRGSFAVWGGALALLVAPLPLGPGAAASAGDPPPAAARPAAEAPGDGAGEIALVQDMDVRGLLLAVSNLEHKTILWTDGDRKIAQKIVAVPGGVLRFPKGRALQAAQALLVSQEVVIVPLGLPGFEVYFAIDARMLVGNFLLRLKAEPVVVTDATVDELSHRDGVFVSATIPVENLDNLRDARQALARLVTPNNVGNVQEVPAARAFVVSDFAPNVAEIYRVLRQMDVKRGEHRLRPEVFVLEHANPRVVEAHVRTLFQPKAPRVVPGQPPQGDVPDADVRVTGDDDTRQVIVLASDEDLATIRQIVRSLDRPPASKAAEPAKPGDAPK